MVQSDFVPVNRQVRDNWVYQKPEYFISWFEMLACAKYIKEEKPELIYGQLTSLGYGEFVFGLPSWCKRLHVSEQVMKTLIKKLLSSNMIVLKKKHSNFTIYKITNFRKFNQQINQQNTLEDSDVQDTTNQRNNQRATSEQPASNQRATTYKKEKESKEGKEINKTALEIAIDDFKEFRKKIKAPMTEKAVTLLHSELDKLASDDEAKIKILNQSIVKGWKGIFPLNNLRITGTTERKWYDD